MTQLITKLVIIDLLLFGILFCASSTNYIIYNEETLVALSFLSFILFVSHYYGETIRESLNERSNLIKVELQNLGLGKKETLNILLSEYQKLLKLNHSIEKVNRFTGQELTNATLRGEKALAFFFLQQIQQKLKTLSFSKLALEQKLQSFMAATLFANVHVQFERLKQQQKKNFFDRQLIENAIQILS
jgi:hypothetical protein